MKRNSIRITLQAFSGRGLGVRGTIVMKTRLRPTFQTTLCVKLHTCIHIHTHERLVCMHVCAPHTCLVLVENILSS